MRFLGKSVDNDVIAKKWRKYFLTRGPFVWGAQGPNAGKD